MKLEHYKIDVEYDEKDDEHHLKVKPLVPIKDCKEIERKEDPFNIDDYPELAWLKGFRVKGYPDVIRVPLRMPPFQLEYVPARIEWYEKRHFKCTVLVQPEMNCKINKGDTIDVVHFMFERMHQLRCTTVEERNGFEWRLGRRENF